MGQKDYYHIFIKHTRVIGTPFPHNTRKLEEDDTDFILNQNNFSVLTNEMMEDMNKIDKLISKEKEIRKLNPVELGYQDIFEEIQEINQNKIFNGIIFKQLLLKIQKVAEEGENNNKLGNTKIVKAYEPLIEKFIIHCQLVLQNQNTQKTDLSKDIKFNEQDLIQSPLLTPDLEKMLETPGKIFSRNEIGRLINISKERTIDVMITRLRQKIELNPKNPKYLQTIRGSGYVLWVE